MDTPIKTLAPSILQFAHLFVMPGLVLLIPEPGFILGLKPWVFWILELAALVYTLFMIGMTKYEVTSLRVGAKSVDMKSFGIVNTAVPIENITDIYVRQNPIQALLGIGNVEVDTAGGDGIELVMVGVENPIEIQNLIIGLKGGIQ